MKKRNHLIFLLKFSNFQIINFLQNTQFKSNVLFTGSILNVESATLKVSEGREKAAIDPDNTVCHENGGKMKRYTQIMRVFYVIGEPANETIGLVIFSTFHFQLKNNFSCSNIFIHIFFFQNQQEWKTLSLVLPDHQIWRPMRSFKRLMTSWWDSVNGYHTKL